MSERTRELTENELDAVSGGFTSSEHESFGEGDLMRLLGEIMAGVRASQARPFWLVPPIAQFELENCWERRAQFREAVASVYREVLDLVYYHGNSVKAVADILGVKEGTVKTRMFYGCKKLAELVGTKIADAAAAGCTGCKATPRMIKRMPVVIRVIGSPTPVDLRVVSSRTAALPR